MRSVVVSITLLVSQVALAGVRLESQDESDKGPIGQQRIQVQGDKVRFDRTIQGNPNARTSIFDGTQLFSIDNKTKTYVVFDPAQLKMQMETLKQMQATLPPEARGKLEATKGQDKLGQVTFRKATGGDTVAGFSCSNYTELRDGVERGTVCASSWNSGPLKKEDLGALKKLAKTMTPGELTGKALVVNPDEWPGFPLSVHYTDGKTTRVTGVTRVAIPDSEFEPPAGYTRRPTPTLGRPVAPPP